MATTFSTKLEFDEIQLEEPDDVVRFSFIVQNSLSYLNLDLCEYSKAGKSSRSVLEIANDFVSTEEKSRKIFTPTRSLLYTLHLDIPVGREYSLKNVPPISDAINYESKHIGRILLRCSFHSFAIARFIGIAIESTSQRLKLLAFLQNSPFLKRSLLLVHCDDLNTIIGFFYPNICDTSLFKGFLEVFNLETWMYQYEKPEVLDFLLYHACLYGIDVETRCFNMSFVVFMCFDHRVFFNIKSWLKYVDTSEYSASAYSCHLCEISRVRRGSYGRFHEETETLLSKQRMLLILQIVSTYIGCSEHGRIAAASEAFRLLWNSYPHPFICLEEVRMAFDGILSEEDMSGSFEFYCNSIGAIPSCVEPRTLQQLCRTTIRRKIKENKFWIPEGVVLTGLPKRLQAFLNLEEIPITD